MPPTSSATRSWSSPATRSPTSTWRRCGSSTTPTTGSPPSRRSRVADTSEFGVAITGSDGRIQGFQEKPDPSEALSDLANCGIYMFRSEIFDYFPGPGQQGRGARTTRRASPTGRWTSSRPCSTPTSPSTRTRSTPTGTTSATSTSCTSGNFDALAGEVEVERGAPESLSDGDRTQGARLRRRGRRDRPRGDDHGPARDRPALPHRRRGDAEGDRRARGHRGAGGSRGGGRRSSRRAGRELAH